MDGDDRDWRDWLSRLRQMPLWIKAASGIVPLGIAAVIFTVLFHAKAPAHAPDQPAISVPQPPGQSGPAAITSTADSASTAKPVETAKQTHPAKTPQATTDQAAKLPPVKPVDSRRPDRRALDTAKTTTPCTLNPNDIASALSIADARFQNRQYKEAERRYRSVLACQPENSHAANGAERARTALQLQPSSNP
jgi:type IV secretory pathway VirB10-like protein